MLHPEFGAPLREASGGGKAIIPSAKKRGGPGVTLDVPLHYKDAAFVRSHFDAVELRIVDAPADDELVIAVAVTDGGRPLPRVGGLQVSEIVGRRRPPVSARPGDPQHRHDRERRRRAHRSRPATRSSSGTA